MDLVECDDDEANDGAALFKTVEAFRGAFLDSGGGGAGNKGAGGGGAGGEVAGGGGAGREMMDSNTSLPSIIDPQAFFGCFCDLF